MGFTDFLSRNASGEPEKESAYDEKFVVASINNFFVASERIRSVNTEFLKEKKRLKLMSKAAIHQTSSIETIPLKEANKAKYPTSMSNDLNKLKRDSLQPAPLQKFPLQSKTLQNNLKRKQA